MKTFAGHVETVDEDARKLANFMHGAEWKSLNASFETDLNRLRNLPALAPLCNNRPVADYVQEVVNNSTIFNWEDNALNHGRGTASVSREVERDLRNQRTRVLASDSDRRLKVNLTDWYQTPGQSGYYDRLDLRGLDLIVHGIPD